MKIAFFEIEQWEREYLKEKLNEFELYFFEESLNSVDEIPDVEILSPFIYSNIKKEDLEKFQNLKYITTRSTGFDHVDTKTAKEKNILVSNVPTYGENTVAEHTFALILTLTRKLCPSLERTKKGDFSPDGLMGVDLKNKTIGVVGTGSIGRQVIRIAKGFQMNVLAYDVKEDESLDVQYVSLEELYKNSDIVSFHVPYNENTKHLVNLENVELFKKGSFLINTARGGVCDTTAILKGLKEEIFAGVGLDVLEEECFIKEEREILTPDFKKNCDMETILESHILLNQPNVIITPHNAFNSKEALTRILDTTIENIKSFVEGNVINSVE